MTALAIGIWLAALALVVAGARGRMEMRRGRCASCGHDLHDPLPQRCAECGAFLAIGGADDARRIHWGIARSRPWLIVAGVVVLALSLVALQFAGRTRVAPQLVGGARIAAQMSRADVDRIAAIAPEELSGRLTDFAAIDASMAERRTTGSRMWAFAPTPLGDSEQRLWAEVCGAIAANALTPEQLLVVAEIGARYLLERSDALILAGEPGDALDTILADRLLGEEQLHDLFARLAIAVRLHAPSIVGSNGEIFLIPDSSLETLNATLRRVRLDLVVAEVRHDGATLETVELEEQASARTNVPRRGTGEVGVTIERLGETELAIDLLVRVVDPLAASPADLGSDDAPALEFSLASIRHRLEVVAADDPRTIPRPFFDPQRADRVRAAISISRVVIADDLDGRSHLAQLVAELTSLPECALDFDVAIRMPDGDIPLGNIAVEQLAVRVRRMLSAPQFVKYPITHSVTGWIPAPPEGMATATLVLTPADTDEIRMGGSDRRWSERVIIEGVEIHRLRNGVRRGNPRLAAPSTVEPDA